MTPRNFSWVVEGELAASARPLGFAELLSLRDEGIGAVVSLTERPLPPGELDECGLAALHLPVDDFAPPTLDQIQTLAAFYEEQRAVGRPMLVHCHAGIGRTGTAAACLLVWRDHLDAADAIERVRALRPGSIETGEQEQLIHAWAEHLRSRSKDKG